MTSYNFDYGESLLLGSAWLHKEHLYSCDLDIDLAMGDKTRRSDSFHRAPSTNLISLSRLNIDKSQTYLECTIDRFHSFRFERPKSPTKPLLVHRADLV